LYNKWLQMEVPLFLELGEFSYKAVSGRLKDVPVPETSSTLSTDSTELPTQDRHELTQTDTVVNGVA